ncbi:integral membrane [Fusarium albosuccineum]|uniref:Integral membrane n=1 Tax=Fusarium albosuccineum TaxID=1237068 RepID=A0A8H4PDY2_9HYPO|nr:integral membrane [Fusarium albosuccineum]
MASQYEPTVAGEHSQARERQQAHYEADNPAVPTSPLLEPRSTAPKDGWRAKLGLGGVARRTLGFALLMLTVFFWTLYNFIASYIFSDHTYNKPFFVVYLNTSIFAISLIPKFVRYVRRNGLHGLRYEAGQLWTQYWHPSSRTKTIREDPDEGSGEGLISGGYDNAEGSSNEKMGFHETAIVSFEFCMLWFSANYFSSACLEYTTVSSATILTSTSSVWTLVFCSLFGIERFSAPKVLGVAASLFGVILISTVDLSGKSDEARGSFPHKTSAQIAIGDSMAFFSAVIYGLYVTVMKKKVPNEDKVDMQIFFGMVGVFNLILLWPLFFILHWTGLETFELPPSGTIWGIILFNAVSSFVSDISWAFALLMTSPLVVTVGLSLTIPLSLIGEILQYSQYSSFTYWVGAAVVLVSFIVVSRESQQEEDKKQLDDLERSVNGGVV